MRQQLKHSAYSLKPAEVRKIIHSTNSFRDRCLIKALYYAGLRRQEATRLDIRDIDFERERITVREGKGGKTRIVPVIDGDFLSDLKHLIGDRKTGYVFLSTHGDRLTVRSINKIVQQAGQRAGITNPNPALRNINPHLLRHSISRWRKNQGFSAEWIQNFLGHASFRTTMDMYDTLSIDEMQEEAQRRLGG
jgi:integrase